MSADQPPAIVQILGDPGGTLGERQAVVAWLKRIAVRVEIVGECNSSCLWFFTLPPEQVCVMPGALLAHHTPDGAVAWERGRDAAARGVVQECRR